MAGGLVVVDYWADWCSPCKQLSPIIEELSNEYGDVKFVKVDTNSNPNLAADQGILSLPTLQFFQGGRVAKSLSGGKTKNALKKAIDELR
ncbi:thioredoxin [Tessaracoccus flavescens]|nr:thioredoxin [Tessaracoccus flavescens]